MAAHFSDTQAAFAAYIRDPEQYAAPNDVTPQRMSVYRELFFNNINGFLSSGFPVLKQLLTEEAWLAMVQDFFAHHRCHSPHFSQISEAFLDYLPTRQHPNDPPFLFELAHYEWVEMALSIDTAESPASDLAWITALPERAIAVSPVAWPLAYRFPVHCISPDYQPQQAPAEPTYLIVYRAADDTVQFMQASALIYQLLDAIDQQTGQSALACIAQMLAPLENTEQLAQHALTAITQLAEKGILIPA